MRSSFTIRSVVAMALATAVVASGRPAAADEAHDRSVRAFEIGRRALEEGDISAAITALEASVRQEPSIGAYYNLGVAHERTKELFLAYRAYRMAGRIARERHDPRQAEADAAAEAMAEKLPKITLQVSPRTRALPGLEITIDEERIPEAELDRPLPVDVGVHEITATADRIEPWRTRANEGVVTIDLAGPVEPAVAPAFPSPPVERERRAAPRDPYRTAGFVVGGAGIGALAVGVVAGVVAVMTHDARGEALDSLCPKAGDGTRACPFEEADARRSSVDEARRENDYRPAATVSTVGFAAAGVLLLAGGALLLLGPRAAANVSAAAVRPVVGMGTAGLTFGGIP